MITGVHHLSSKNTGDNSNEFITLLSVVICLHSPSCSIIGDHQWSRMIMGDYGWSLRNVYEQVFWTILVCSQVIIHDHWWSCMMVSEGKWPPMMMWCTHCCYHQCSWMISGKHQLSWMVTNKEPFTWSVYHQWSFTITHSHWWSFVITCDHEWSQVKTRPTWILSRNPFIDTIQYVL
jgi:hypothetical protein